MAKAVQQPGRVPGLPKAQVATPPFKTDAGNANKQKPSTAIIRKPGRLSYQRARRRWRHSERRESAKNVVRCGSRPNCGRREGISASALAGAARNLRDGTNDDASSVSRQPTTGTRPQPGTSASTLAKRTPDVGATPGFAASGVWRPCRHRLRAREN